MKYQISISGANLWVLKVYPDGTMSRSEMLPNHNIELNLGANSDRCRIYPTANKSEVLIDAPMESITIDNYNW